MATTTNYGWTTPNDTDLVKDGAAAIRTLGSSIDTTVFANASAGIPKSTITTKGDLIVGTGAGTFVRQGIGTNGQVLVADSAEADGLKWATPAGGGKLLQVVTATYATEVSTSSASFVDSGLTATITPTLSTSTILVLVNQQIGLTSTQNDQIMIDGYIVRGATNIYNWIAEIQGAAYSNVLRYRNNDTFIYRDSPATTSATTYKTRFRSAAYGTVFTQPEARTSTITLMEIGA